MLTEVGKGAGSVCVFVCYVGVTVLCRIAREGLPEKPSPKGDEGESHAHEFYPRPQVSRDCMKEGL